MVKCGRHILHLVTQHHHSKIDRIQFKIRRLKPITLPMSEKLLRVNYHLCKLHTLDTAFGMHQSSENTNRYFHIIDNACVRNSPNGTIGNFTNGTIGSQWYNW